MLVRQQPGKTASLPGEFPSPRMLYQVLSACQSPSFPVPEFEPFYLDTSHRLRHGTAAAVVLEEAGKPAACALALAVTDTAAAAHSRGGGSCFPERNGLGRQAVETLCRRFVRAEGISVPGPRRKIRRFMRRWAFCRRETGCRDSL